MARPAQPDCILLWLGYALHASAAAWWLHAQWQDLVSAWPRHRCGPLICPYLSLAQALVHAEAAVAGWEKGSAEGRCAAAEAARKAEEASKACAKLLRLLNKNDSVDAVADL